MPNIKKSMMAAAGAGGGGGGQLWAWGSAASYFQLGLGNNTTRSSPVQVGDLTTWSIVSSGFGHTLAIKSDGTLWAWGANGSGRLGTGNSTVYSSPVQVGSETDWTAVACQPAGSLGIRGGNLFSWGQNIGASLGRGAGSGSVNSPALVGAGMASVPTWAACAGASAHGLAVTTDGALFTWGTGTEGRLGHGNTTKQSHPVQVGSLTDWAIPVALVGASGCLKTDGTIWMWGDGGTGKTGHGNTTKYSSPVQTGSDTNWIAFNAAITKQHCMAINDSGELYAWGEGAAGGYGKLGVGDTSNRSNPTQVSGGGAWADVECSHFSTMAVKTDGTLWGWGDGNLGQTAHGNTTEYSSPVQVGSLTDWTSVGGGGTNFAFGLKA